MVKRMLYSIIYDKNKERRRWGREKKEGREGKEGGREEKNSKILQ